MAYIEFDHVVKEYPSGSSVIRALDEASDRPGFQKLEKMVSGYYLAEVVRTILADLAKQGKSIIMISSEMSEIIGMSNRVMVMCDGRITGFIDGKDATQENIMALATQFETAPEKAAANQ